MANEIRTGDSRGFNKGRSSKFRDGSRVRQTPEEARRTFGRKNKKDEDNSPKNIKDKNHQAFSQKLSFFLVIYKVKHWKRILIKKSIFTIGIFVCFSFISLKDILFLQKY